MLRLTRMARSPLLRKHLKDTVILAPCRQRVEDAGCSLEPSWGDGAQLFIPLTHEQLAEAELELSFDHVIILNSEADLFRTALREFNCKGKVRPKLATLGFDSMFHDKSHPVTQMEKASSHSSSMVNNTPEKDSDDEEGTVEVEPVGFFTTRTDSSFGFPESPYA